MTRMTLAVLAFVVTISASAAEQFLTAEEIAKLQPIEGIEGAKRYSPTGKLAGDYEKMLIGSVTFYFDEDSKIKEIDADEMKQISDAMKQALVEVASKDWQIVHEPGPGVAQVNVAITNIAMKNKKRGLLGYTPIGLVVTAAGNLAGLRTKLTNAQLQGEVVDSESGEMVVIFASDIGEYDEKKGMSWEDVRQQFIDSASKAVALQQQAQ